MSEITEAAERLRRVNAGEDICEVYPDGVTAAYMEGLSNDEKTVADGALALGLFQADDETPLDEEWVESHPLYRRRADTTWVGPAWFGYFGDGDYEGVVDCNGGFSIKTRGQLRRLLAAMGVGK